jgi:uncharacterized protein YegL
MPELADIQFLNADPRCACVLLLDTSGSMGGEPIAALNAGLQAFQKELQGDALASRRVEIAIVTFGNGGVQAAQDFVTAGQFTAPQLQAGGDTPMGAAIHLALDMIKQRKATYKSNGVLYYRPWAFMITDGGPTDEWQSAARRLKEEEAAKGVSFFAVGVGGANMQRLGEVAVRTPLKLDGLKFVELFVWLSQSQKRVSASKVGEQTGLPPVGWTSV